MFARFCERTINKPLRKRKATWSPVLSRQDDLSRGREFTASLGTDCDTLTCTDPKQVTARVGLGGGGGPRTKQTQKVFEQLAVSHERGLFPMPFSLFGNGDSISVLASHRERINRPRSDQPVLGHSQGLP